MTDPYADAMTKRRTDGKKIPNQLMKLWEFVKNAQKSASLPSNLRHKCRSFEWYTNAINHDFGIPEPTIPKEKETEKARNKKKPAEGGFVKKIVSHLNSYKETQ